MRARPAFLRRFDLDALEAEASSMAAVEADGRIVWTNGYWRRFAVENGAGGALATMDVGASYFGAIEGELRGLYWDAFRWCLDDGMPFELDYECSSAETFRLFRMRILPVHAEGAMVAHSLRAERPHDRVAAAALEARYRRVDGFVVQCSNCRRVRRADGTAWDWVPAFVADPLPATSHGLCSLCADWYYGRLRRRR